MNVTTRTLLQLGIAALAVSATACPLARDLTTVTAPFFQADPTAPHKPLGIEGNGLLGIEGNGIVQRRDSGELVVNDSLYAPGPGKVWVFIDASAASVTDIQPGHVVLAGARVPSQGASPTLARIELDHLLRGPVEAGGINLGANTIRVLGQALVLEDYVEISDATGDIKIDDLVDGDYLRVSGWLDADGDVVVTRLERLPPLPETLELSGRVAGLDANGQTLQIGEMTIDFASAQFVYMAAAELSLDDRLEVVGNSLDAGGILSATRIRRVPAPLSAEAGQEVEIQGYVEQPIVSSQFLLAGQWVVVSGATVYERGDAADVVPGRLVEVEGLIGADGSLLAERVEFDEEVIESEIRIAGSVESVDSQTEQFGLFGLTISAGVATRYEDKTGSAAPFAGFSDLEPGTFIELRGYDQPDGSNTVAASRIAREIEDVASLKARVTANDGNAIAVLGLTVWTDTGTRYKGIDGNSISESQFVAQAQVGVLVRATGMPAPGGIDASLVEIE